MGIAVRINSLQDALNSAPDIHEIDQNQITIGSYNDDTIKLEHRKLQGKHIRIHSEWNRNSGQTRLVVTNISGSSRLLVGNRLLNEDETQVLDENMRIQMGEYRLTAGIHNADIQSVLNGHLDNNQAPDESEVPEESFMLDSFTPDDLAMDNAIQSLLKSDTKEHSDIKEDDQKIATSEVNAETEEILAAESEKDFEISEPPQAMTPEEKPEVLQTPEVPADLQAGIEAKAVNATKQNDTVREIPDNIVSIQKENSVRTDSRTPPSSDAYGLVEQTLFEHIAGLDDVQEMDFDALRLLDIRGQISHNGKPIAGMEINGGELGMIFTDHDGKFCFENIIEGTHYQINVKHDGYLLSGKDTLSGILGQDVTADLRATRLTRVTGRLTHAGKPLSGIQLDAGEYGTCTSDGEGYYNFENIPEGAKLAISASRSGYTFKRKTQADKASKPTYSQAKPVKTPAAASTPSKLASISRDVSAPAAETVQDDVFASSLAILTGKNQAVAG